MASWSERTTAALDRTDAGDISPSPGKFCTDWLTLLGRHSSTQVRLVSLPANPGGDWTGRNGDPRQTSGRHFIVGAVKAR